MSQLIPDDQSQTQDNLVKDTNVSGDLTFAPVQIGTKIETQIIQSSLDTVTQRKLIKNSPYQGLKRFNFKDRDRFFGRDKLIIRLFEAVNRSSLSLVLGASGSGKSSVVRAGLIPELKKFLEYQKFYDFIFTPNQDPFNSLYRCLLSEEKDYSFSKSEAEIALEVKADTLTQVISTLKKDEERWLIFVDQFEELFTICDSLDKRINFIEGLVQVAKSGDSSVRIVLAMRSDFLDQFSFYPDLGAIANQNNIHLVTEMYPDELRQAIEQPAARHGVVFEEGLVEQIIKEVERQSGYLPLLQYTLNLFWQSECLTISSDGVPYIEHRTLNKASYAALEGVRGALQKRVNAIYKDICQKHKDGEISTKQIFMNLVNIVDTDSGSRAVSRRAYLNEFVGESVKNILDSLIDENLLISSYEYITQEKLLISSSKEQKQSATVEIAHEILLSSWDTLKTWIEEDKEAIILKNWLAGETRRWQKISSKNKSQAKDELLKGSRLAQVVELRAKNAFKNVGGLRLEENQFIDASVEWRDCLLKQEKERRKLQIMVTSMTTVVFAGFAIFAGYQWRQAEIGQIQALNQTSKANFTVNRNSFDALIEVLNAGKRLKRLPWGSTDKQLQANFLTTLEQSVNWVREQNRLKGHQDVVQSVSFRSDGQMLATASYDNTVKLWRQDGSLFKTLEGHTKPVMNVRFSPDGKTIASGSQDGTVRLWDSNGNLIQVIPAHKDRVMSVSFSPDGQTIATGSADKTAKLWHMDGQLLSTLREHQGLVRQVSFSPKGDRMITVSDDKTVKLWSQDGKKLLKTLNSHTDAVVSADFSPDGRFFATASVDKTVKLWNQEGELLRTFKHPGQVWSVSFSSDGQTIASGSQDGTVRLWAQDGRLLDTWAGHEGAIPSVAFSPDGKILATVGNDHITKLWQVNRSWLTVLVEYQYNVLGAKFSLDGNRIASANSDGTLRIWSRDGKLLSTLTGHKDKVNAVSFSPDRKTIASGGDDKTIRLWRVDGQPLKTLREHKDRVLSISFSPDGQMIASASADGTAKLWSLDGKEPKTLTENSSRVLSVAFSSDGHTIATAGDDKTVKLWSYKGKELRRWKAHTSEIWSVGFSPDGQTIITASGDKTIKLWQLDGTLITTLSGHTASVLDASFSPNGKMIASASSDQTIKLWQRDGTLITTLSGHTSAVHTVSFSPDSKWLASAGADKLVLLWDVSDISLKGLLEKGCRQVSDYLKTQANSLKKLCN